MRFFGRGALSSRWWYEWRLVSFSLAEEGYCELGICRDSSECDSEKVSDVKRKDGMSYFVIIDLYQLYDVLREILPKKAIPKHNVLSL
jgi:hypothetical protein